MCFNSIGNHRKIYISTGIHRGSPIQRWVPPSNIIIKFSCPELWESDSAQENHTLPCNITLKINQKLRLRFRDGTIHPPIRANVPSLNLSPVLELNIEFMTTSRVIR